MRAQLQLVSVWFDSTFLFTLGPLQNVNDYVKSLQGPLPSFDFFQ